MRIISGKFKNKKLFFPKNLKTRPLKDSVKENIFNILEHSNNFDTKIKNSSILDLYAGAGSFGIECLSREASDVFFVENDASALKNLRENIDSLKLIKQASIYSLDVFEFFKNLSNEKKFDLVFLDPPFANNEYIKIIEIIKKNNVLKKKHTIVFHRERKKQEKVNAYLNIIENRIYGRSELFFGNLF